MKITALAVVKQYDLACSEVLTDLDLDISRGDAVYTLVSKEDLYEEVHSWLSPSTFAPKILVFLQALSEVPDGVLIALEG